MNVLDVSVVSEPGNRERRLPVRVLNRRHSPVDPSQNAVVFQEHPFECLKGFVQVAVRRHLGVRCVRSEVSKPFGGEVRDSFTDRV